MRVETPLGFPVVARGVVERDRIPLVVGPLPGELRIAAGEKRLVVEFADCARRPALQSAMSITGMSAYSAIAPFTMGESSVSHSMSSASPWPRRTRISLALRRVLSAFSTRRPSAAEIRLVELRNIRAPSQPRWRPSDSARGRAEAMRRAQLIGLLPGVTGACRARPTDDRETRPRRAQELQRRQRREVRGLRPGGDRISPSATASPSLKGLQTAARNALGRAASRPPAGSAPPDARRDFLPPACAAFRRPSLPEPFFPRAIARSRSPKTSPAAAYSAGRWRIKSEPRGNNGRFSRVLP